MPKITQEQKEKVYELYNQGYRGKKIGRLVGIDGSYAQRILRSFDAGDFSWLNSSFRHFEKAFTESEKEMIVNDFLNTHRTFSEHVAKTGIPQGILQAWIRNYNIYGVCMRKHGRPPKDGSNDRISEENQRTGKEASIRAKRDHYLQNVLPGLCRGRDGSSKKKILRTVGECRRLGIPLRDCLSRLNLSSSTCHFWKKHENDINKEDKELEQAIKQVQESNHWAYGAKRMAKSLVSEGFYERINHKRVERIMSSCGLHAKVRRRRYPKSYYLTLKENSGQLPKNVLARNFVSETPRKRFVTDITYLPAKEGWLYLAAVMDLYNHEIVSYRASRFMSLNLVTEVVKQMTKQGINLQGTMIHSDMGWTYTNRVYVECLRGLGVHQSMSRKGNCWDNACIENFFGLFKSETIRQRSDREALPVDLMKKLVDDYIYWFNNQRIQKKLGYLSPVNYRKLAT